MLPQPEKVEDAILVTHQGCMDGSGCAVMFIASGGKPENVRYVAAGMVERFVKEDPVFQSDSFLIFADVGLNTPKYADVFEKRGNLVLLDHHKTSLHMKGRTWAEIDAEGNGGTRCGTRMLRDYLIRLGGWYDGYASLNEQARVLKSSSYRFFAETVDDFDRWIRSNHQSEDLADLHVFYGQQEFVRRFSGENDPKQRRNSNISDGLSHAGFLTRTEREIIESLRKRRDEQIERAVEKAILREISLSTGSVKAVVLVSSLPYTSVMLERAQVAHPGTQVAVQVDLDNGKCSWRTDDPEIDVALACREFRGGGHRAAAGHRLPSDLYETVLENIYG
jgi:hypothetical protein